MRQLQESGIRARRARGRALLVLALTAATAFGGLLLAPAGQAAGGGAIPPEFAMVQVRKPIKCAEAGEKAGWRGKDLVIATAISLAESGCDPKAVGTNGPTSGCPNGSDDRGAWQINDCYHPSVSDACAFDMQCNANEAYRIYQESGSDFDPWSTWNSRSFQYHLNPARRAVKKLTGNNIVVGVVNGPLNIRKNHNTRSEIVGTLADDEVIKVRCQARGEEVTSTYTTRLWDKIAKQQYVSNAYVYTDNEGRVARRCGG